MKKPSNGIRKLRAFKDACGVTYDELAEMVAKERPELGACSRRTLEDIAYGVRSPSLRMAAKIEALTGVRAGDWFGS